MDKDNLQTGQVQAGAEEDAEETKINPDELDAVLSEAGENDAENEADFTAAFNDEHAVEEKPAEEVTTPPEGEEVQAAKKDEPQTPDVKEELPATPEKAEEEKPLSEIEKLQKHIRKLEGKFGNVNQQINDLVKHSNKIAEDKGVESPTRAEIRKAMEDAREGKKSELRENYPEWAEAIDAEAMVVGEHIMSKMPTPEQITSQINSAILDFNHKGWQDTTKSDAFLSWLEDQTPETRALAKSSDVRDAADLLTRYDNYVNPPPAPGPPAPVEDTSKKSILEAAIQPTSGKSARTTTDTEHQEFKKAFSS